MRLLVDTCVSAVVCDRLTEAGHDVVWVGDWDDDPGDEAILQFTNQEGRIIITLDHDFGDLAVSWNRTHSGIICLRNHRITNQALGCCEALQQHGDDLEKGAVVVVQPGRIRCRFRPQSTLLT